MKRLDSIGSHIIAVAVVLLVVGVIGFGAYAVTNRDATGKDSNTVVTTSESDDIKTADDLTETAATLDGASAQVDSSLNDSSLDNDLNDLL